MFYNGLTVLDEQLNPLPDLATSIENERRQGLDRQAAQGRACSMTASRSPRTTWCSRSSATRIRRTARWSQPLADQFEEIKATGTNEVTDHTAGAECRIADDPRIYHFLIVKDGTTDFNKGIGTGPFMCKEFSPGVRSLGVRNPNYFQAGQAVSRPGEFFGIPDDAARVNALLSGDIELAGAINPHSTTRRKGSEGLRGL